MKNITNTLLFLLVAFLFSCISDTEQKIKEVEQEEIIKDTIAKKIAIASDSLLIVKEDTVVNVPDIRKDNTPIVGVLTSIEESDFWGRVWLHMDVNGEPKTYAYWGEPETDCFVSFKNVRNLTGKKIAIKFRIEKTLEEVDLHVNNTTTNPEYGRIKTEKQKKYFNDSKIEGTLLVHEHDKSGDLPSTYRIIDDKGDTTTITAFVYDEHVALNGKRATVYTYPRVTYIAKSVVTLEKKEFNVDHYICYKNDKDTNQYIWVSFAKKEGALQVKYKGQKDAINLIFDREDYFCDGCAHPTIDNYYNEIYNGKVNGVYKLTHSGVWDYVEYTRGQDGKVFNYTIDHHKNPYGKSPCF